MEGVFEKSQPASYDIRISSKYFGRLPHKHALAAPSFVTPAHTMFHIALLRASSLGTTIAHFWGKIFFKPPLLAF